MSRSKRMIGRVPQPRRAALARVRDPATGEVIDEGLALWFPAPHSETGEDIAELQIHGGRAVIAATLAALREARRLPPRRGRRVHPPRLRERPHGFDRGRGARRPGGGRDRGAAPAGVPATARACSASGRRVARTADRRRRALLEAGIDFSDEGDVPKELGAAGARRSFGRWPTRSVRPGGARASVCAMGCESPSRDRPMPASRRCSTGSRGARSRSCRRMPARPATSSKCTSISAAFR